MTSTPGHWLHVTEAGPADGERLPVLLVHGGCGSWQNWRAQLEFLGRNHRVLAPDLRGHGGSPWPGPSTVDEFYTDLQDLVRSELPERFAVIAHSFGGYLATRLAVDYPKRVQALALVNTAGHIPRGLAYRLLELFSDGASLMRQLRPSVISTESRVAKSILQKTLPGWDCWELYARLSVPTLVAVGGLDPLIPLELGRRTANAIARSRLEVVPAGGHVLMWQQPERLNGWLEELLESRRSA
ncbi:MAG: alpha/beta hydrolase [Armatimonadetes bacterium]|nr:alpha/beta hydrolase [Armatimonadota bacterium]